MPVASRVKCPAAGVLHRKPDFAWQTGIKQLCACKGDAGRQLEEFPRPDALLTVESQRFGIWFASRGSGPHGELSCAKFKCSVRAVASQLQAE